MMMTIDPLIAPNAQESTRFFAHRQDGDPSASTDENHSHHGQPLEQFPPRAPSLVLTEARRLYRHGISPVPIKHASKFCFKGWQRLTVTRLYGPMLDQVFDNDDVKVGVAAVVGRVSGNLFVVDCDTPQAATWMHEQLNARGMRTWIRSSSRGAHFWFRCLDGEVENQSLPETGYEVLGHDRIAVAPGSIHPRTGEVLEWMNEPLPPLLEVGVADMAWLGLRLFLGGKKRREKAGALPPVADRVLVERDARAYGADNSRAEWAAIWSLMGAGYGDDEIASIFARYAPPHYCKIGEIEWLRSDLHRAREKYEMEGDDAGQNSVLARLALRMRACVEAASWPGATGNTDRAVLVALSERMRLDNSEVFRASHREIAVLAGMSIVTVGKSLKRLSSGDAPWIISTGANAKTGANTWKFTARAIEKANIIAKSACSTDTVARKGYAPMHNTVSVLHDARPPVGANGGAVSRGGLHDLGGDADTWHRLALGKSAQALMAHLVASPDGARVKDIAVATGKCDSTVKRALAKLEEHGIVHKDGDAWHVSRDADLAPVAHECGTDGKTRAKKLAFEKERQIEATRWTLDSMMRAGK